jgi:c-di-GMP-binding flagellar brake protein YcgR
MKIVAVKHIYMHQRENNNKQHLQRVDAKLKYIIPAGEKGPANSQLRIKNVDFSDVEPC